MGVYLDHNSTTPLRPKVRERVLQLLSEDLGNPSGTHSSGRRARAVLDDAREQVAACLRVPESWIIFTSGGTEANNQALFGALAGHPGRPLAVSAAEHPSVLQAAQNLEQRGHPLGRLGVLRNGRLDLDDLHKQLQTPGLRIISCMLANNENGALAPMEQIAEALAARGKERPLWHADCVQALGKLPLALREWGVDLASFSAHKVGGPLGVGVLVCRENLGLPALLHGGGQESGARSGTENVVGIGAAALAIELAATEEGQYAAEVGELTRKLWCAIQREIPGVQLLGPAIDEPRLPNTLNLFFPNLDGRLLVARLDLEGLEASLGSACSSGAAEPSHVLLAMGYDPSVARGGLRLSLGRTTTHKDIHSTVDTLRKVSQSMLATR